MNFDFALVLVLLTALAGLGWLIDKIWFASAREERLEAAHKSAAAQSVELDSEQIAAVENLPMWADLSKSMFPVLAFVLVLRSFIIEPFQIPSGSMLPTLKIGDFILVNKFSYGLRLPVLNTKFIETGEPQRGDVVVFKFPGDPSVNYIKRLVGVPGDVVSYHDKVISINGVAQPQTFIANLAPNTLLKENLSGVEHQIYNTPQRSGVKGTWTVPQGQYFVMGDNRDNSNDSRYWEFVPDSLMVGKAFAVWMHWPTFFSLPDFSAARGIE